MNRSKATLIAICTLLGLGAAGAHAQKLPPPFVGTAAKSAICTRQNLIQLGAAVEGFARLCLTPGAATGIVQASNLTAGDAYTVWFVYIDHPEQCAMPNQCADVDFGGDNPVGVFGRFDSSVAPVNGRLRFSGSVSGFQPSNGSQIWLLIYDHGAADYSDGRHLARQLLTPEDPAAGAPNLGNIVDGPGFTPAGIAVFVQE